MTGNRRIDQAGLAFATGSIEAGSGSSHGFGSGVEQRGRDRRRRGGVADPHLAEDEKVTARLPQSIAKASSEGSSARSTLKSRVPRRGLSQITPGIGASARVPASTTSSGTSSSRANTEIAAPPEAKFAIIAIVTCCG